MKRYWKFLKKELIDWWYDVSDIVRCNIDLSLNYSYLCLKIFDNGFEGNFKLPRFINSEFDMGWFGGFNIGKYKGFEWQLMYSGYLKTGFGFVWTMHKNHAGILIHIALFGWELALELYDCRHWNYDKDEFYKKGEMIPSNKVEINLSDGE